MVDIVKAIELFILKVRKFIHREILWRVQNLEKTVKGEKSSSYDIMIRVRQREAILNPSEIVIDGDSRIHFGEQIIETIDGVSVRAIAGDTTDGTLERLSRNALLDKPKIYITDVAGNDFLQGRTIEYVYHNLMSIFKQFYDIGTIKVAWINGLPPGNPELAPYGFLDKSLRNVAALHRTKRNYIDLENMLKKSEYYKSGFLSIIDVRKASVIDDYGWLKEKYCAPDRIHFQEELYRDVFCPPIKGWLENNYSKGA